MREYVAVPPAILEDAGALSGWMARSLASAAALPPKKKRKRAAKSGS